LFLQLGYPFWKSVNLENSLLIFFNFNPPLEFFFFFLIEGFEIEKKKIWKINTLNWNFLNMDTLIVKGIKDYGLWVKLFLNCITPYYNFFLGRVFNQIQNHLLSLATESHDRITIMITNKVICESNNLFLLLLHN
jgi:hypothetical protein